MAQLASVTVILSLKQRLQNVAHKAQGAGNHSLINWLMSSVQTVWAEPGELPETVSRQTTCLDLVQIIREMGMRQMMFCSQYTSPDEEVFTTCMKDLILTAGLAGTFGTMVMLLAPYVYRRIHEVMSAMAR